MRFIVPIIILAVIAAVRFDLGHAAAAKQGAEYIGVKKCKMCHLKQYKTWAKMKHANNFKVLQGDEKKNPECLSCHTTGYGKGGYELGKAPSHNAKFENVQCESCRPRPASWRNSFSVACG